MKNLLKAAIFSISIFLSLWSCKKDKANESSPVVVDTINSNNNSLCKLKHVKITQQSPNVIEAEFDVFYSGNNVLKTISTLPPSSLSEIYNFTYDSFNLVKRRTRYQGANPQLLESSTFEATTVGSPNYLFRDVTDSFYQAGMFKRGTTSYRYDNVNDRLVNRIAFFPHPSSISTSVTNMFFKNSTNEDIITTLTSTGGNGTVSVLLDSVFSDYTKVNLLNKAFPDFIMQAGNPAGEFPYLPALKYVFLNKHLVTKVINYRNGVTTVNNFAYTFNSKGLIKAIIVNGINKIQIDYTCD